MAKSDKKYADPTEVLQSLTDGRGEAFSIGAQQDIGEFNNMFLQRI